MLKSPPSLPPSPSTIVGATDAAGTDITFSASCNGLNAVGNARCAFTLFILRYGLRMLIETVSLIIQSPYKRFLIVPHTMY